MVNHRRPKQLFDDSELEDNGGVTASEEQTEHGQVTDEVVDESPARQQPATSRQQPATSSQQPAPNIVTQLRNLLESSGSSNRG